MYINFSIVYIKRLKFNLMYIINVLVLFIFFIINIGCILYITGRINFVNE